MIPRPLVRPHVSNTMRPPFLSLVLSLLGCAAFFPGSLASQETPDPGTPIRVVTQESDAVAEGRLVSLTSSTLVYEGLEGRRVRVHRGSVESLEVLRVKRRTGVGVVLGVLTGGLGMATAVLVTSDPRDDSFVMSRGEAAAAGALVGALGGGLLGAVIGHAITAESWEPVIDPGPVVGPSAAAGLGGTRLGVRLRF